MTKSIKLIGAVVLALVLYTVILRIFTPDYLIEKVEVEVERTVEIDSAAVYREYSERIPPEEIDTVYADTLTISDPVAINEDTNEYKTSYSDSTLAASWVTRVLGTLEDQSFEYYLKRRLVQERELTITQNITTLTTKTITKVRSPRPYFIVGAELTNLKSLSVEAGFVTSSRYQIKYRYDTLLKTHSVGVSIPIRFNLKTFL
jgi:hypothetical protein